MNKQHGKWVEMQFSDQPPTKKIPDGLKLVLWKITDTSGASAYDWGFANWSGGEWEAIEVPMGYEATVASWSEPLDPKILLAVPSKIIKLN